MQVYLYLDTFGRDSYGELWRAFGQLLESYWKAIIDDSIKETLCFMISQKKCLSKPGIQVFNYAYTKYPKMPILSIRICIYLVSEYYYTKYASVSILGYH